MKARTSIRLFHFLLAGLVGLAAALPVRLPADDTDIYLGAKTGVGAVQPNVLFVLDTSSSMNGKDGTPYTRLDRMKQALHSILDLATNVNVGLMRFHDRGGPVLYPVSSIDADVCTVEGGCPDVADGGGDTGGGDTGGGDAGGGGPVLTGIQNRTYAITDDDDDGVEGTLGSVVLDSVRLHVGPVNVSGADDTLVTVRVSNNGDDAEERISDGDVDAGSSDLELGRDGGDEQIVAVRFASVNVPKGATIVSAEVVFTVEDNETGELDLDVWGESASGARGGFGSEVDYDISSRPRTSAVVSWNDVAEPDAEQELRSAELSAIVQEIVDHPDWDPNEAMVFMFQRDNTDSNTEFRELHSHNAYPSKAPELRIRYMSGGFTTTWLIGVRYQGVDVPHGSTITYAELDFNAGNVNSEATKVKIYGEDVDDAAPFKSGGTGTHDFTNRSWTKPEAVDWNPATTPPLAAWDATDVNHQTPDIKGIVQKIVNRGGWCGGNDMAFFVEVDASAMPSSVGKRSAYSANEADALAPVLRLTFDADNPQPGANGCNVLTEIAQPQDGFDNAEEQPNGDTEIDPSDLELVVDGGDTQVVGIRFPNINVPRGATIVSADITFTADETDSGTTSLVIRGEKSGNAAQFVEGNGNDNVSSRPTTTAAALWNSSTTPPMVAWSNQGDQFVTPSLAGIVQEIVAQSSWSAGNSMAFIITGSGKRVAESQRAGLDAPRLRIRYQTGTGGGGGSATGASGGGGGLTGITVRDRLHQIVDAIEYRSGTPILGTMTEAARYLRGEPVYFGLQRGPQDKKDKVTRVSHPASYVGDPSILPPGCSELNLSDEDCVDEIIPTGSVSPVYKSPIVKSCQETYIVLLSDGSGAIKGSEKEPKTAASYVPNTWVHNLTGSSACGSKHDDCVVQLAAYLNGNDQITSSSQVLASGSAPLEGDQLIRTYTIGFNAAGEADFLTDVADAGGGKFYDAESADELANVFKEIIGDILKRATSFASPSLAVNAFNKLNHRDEVYFSLFEPSLSKAWHGNVKKYKLCPGTSAGCTLGEVLDADDIPAIGADDKIKETARSLWLGTSDPADGREIRQGGAGVHIPDWTNRVIYTDVSLANDHPATPVQLGSSHQVDVANTDVRDEACSDPTVGNSACDDLIEWILGRDVLDEDDEASTTNRWNFADPLHSSPVVVSYGGTSDDPVDKLFVGTNDGGVRMLNAATGAEEWVFMPKVMLSEQETLMDNPSTPPHIYGLDGVPSFRMNDVNRDGIIDPDAGDFVHMYIGMRRGGRNIYALDVTPPTVLTSASPGGIEPKFLWRIMGGTNDANGDYNRLAQTWSRPKVATIRVDNGSGGSMPKTVLLFGGGYDGALDSSYGTAAANPNAGNAIYIVDADDGTLMRWISSDSNADIVVSDMVHSIPSDLALIDTNGDAATDRIYVGDTGGNVWRVDLGATLSKTSNGGTVVGKLASIATAGTPADERRILYPPDVVQVNDSQYFAGSPSRYDMVVVVTGNRADPLGTAVQNQVYAFRDLAVAGMTDVSPTNGLAEDYPKTGAVPLTQGDLTDLTDNALQDGDDTAKANALADLRASRGWYLNLVDVGEKALAAPIVLGGKLFFTTYLPEAVSGACEAQEGGGRLYALHVLNAKAVLNFDGIGDDTDLSGNDRTYTLGGGIPSSAVPIFQEEGITLLIGTSAGGESVDPGLVPPRVKTFWTQE
ncbi:MAG: PilC/PilY family type IV pilus protein [Gammaproteobacteria bacterium]|nr:PilC/PilY family type IV pilus protein [Gammaproteobacteria bacterium]